MPTLKPLPQADPWGVVSVQPLDPWGVASVQPITPSITDNPNGEGMYQMRSSQGQTVGVPYSKVSGAQGYTFANPREQIRFQKDQAADPNSGVTHSAWAGMKLGGPIDTVSNVGTHLANMVKGPVQAFSAPPSDSTEDAIVNGTSMTPGGSAAALGLYRMFAKPTVDAVSQAIDLRKKGGSQSSLVAPSTYDQNGRNIPTVGSKLVDAIPLYGPWARNAENEAQQKGVLPAAAGLATDVVAPKLLGKFAGATIQGTGKAMQYASTTPPALKLTATRALVPGTPGELLQSALKPGVKYGAGAGNMLESSLPDVLNADPNLQGVSGFARASDVAKDAAYQPYNNMIAPYRPAPGGVGPVRPGSIYGGPIADAQNASIPAINRFESPSARPSAPPPPLRPATPAVRSQVPSTSTPTVRALSMPQINEPSGIVATTAAKADLYRKPISVSTADAVREDANAKLNAFYAKTGGDLNAALSAPETARIKAIGDSTRGQLYPKLEGDAGLQPGSVAQMQQRFGLLSDVSDIANKREPVFARHDPVSLSQQIVLGHGGPITRLTNLATQKLFGGVTNSDALVNSAVDRFRNAVTPLPARPGLFPQVGSAIGGGLYGTGKAVANAPLFKPVGAVRIPVNPLFYSAAANPPKR